MLTLVVCLAFMFAQHRVPAGSWPFISDTFVYPPGDWISRWAVVDAAALATIVHVSIMFVEEGKLCCAKALYTIAIIAIAGVSIVGCVNEQENIVVHSIAAGVFFAGYDAFMVLRTIAHFLPASWCAVGAAPRPSNKARWTLALIALASTSLTIARFCPHARAAVGRYVGGDGGGDGEGAAVEGGVGMLLLPVLEWLDACTICGYMYVSVCLLGDRAKNCGLALLGAQQQQQQQQQPAAEQYLLMNDDEEASSGGGIVLLDASSLTYC